MTKRNHSKSKSIISLLILMACFVLGCTSTEPAPHTSPLFIAIGYDISGSTEKMPQLTLLHIDSLVTLLTRRGGAITFGVIDDEALEPLDRHNVRSVTGTLDQRASLASQNRADLERWKSKIGQHLTRARTAAKTDLYGVLNQFRLYFSEPAIPTDAECVVLLITDGKHTGPRRNIPQLPDRVKILTVGIDTQLQQTLFGDRATALESIEGAIALLEAQKE